MELKLIIFSDLDALQSGIYEKDYLSPNSFLDLLLYCLTLLFGFTKSNKIYCLIMVTNFSTLYIVNSFYDALQRKLRY